MGSFGLQICQNGLKDEKLLDTHSEGSQKAMIEFQIVADVMYGLRLCSYALAEVWRGSRVVGLS